MRQAVLPLLAGLPFLAGLRRHSRSVVVRLSLVAVVLVLVGGLLRLTFLLPFLRDNLMGLLAEHQLSIAQYVARDIDGKLTMRLSTLAALAAHLPPHLLDQPERLEDWLYEHYESTALFSLGLVVIRADGHGAVADFPVMEGRRRLDYADTDYFSRAIRERAPVVGRPRHGRVAGTPQIVMAAPVMDENRQVRAVLVGTTALAAPGFFDLLQETRLGRRGGFLLISPQDNLFVAATDPAKAMTPLPMPGVNPLHDRAMAGYRGTGITTNIDGVEELSAIVSVPATGWFLVARLPTDEAFTAIDHTRRFLLHNSVIAGCVGLLLVGLILHRFFRPLTSAARLIHRMANGEIELQPVPVVRRDEVGDLAEGFNFLLARLDEITAQKLEEKRLRLEEKERLEESLRQWMADTSHELRTPIAVLRAQIEAIEDGVHAADSQTLQVLHRQVMGMSRLVDDLHTLARSDVGQLDCRKDPLAVLGLVDDAVAAFGERFAAAGLTITWADCPQHEPVVLGDAARLGQVFANLLENTLRHTDAGGGLEIRCVPGAATVRVDFDDSPPGVPAECLNRLFDRFYRVDRSRSRDRGGSGIGLSVCKSIVAAHGGTITAAPSPLGGLRITIILPRLTETP